MNFYKRRNQEYIDNYSFHGRSEDWISDTFPDIKGVEDYFNLVKDILYPYQKKTFDIGCGPAARELIRFDQWGSIVEGSDISKEVIHQAKRIYKEKTNKEVIIYNASILDSHQLNTKQDIFTCLNVIQHLKVKSDLERVVNFVNSNGKKDSILILLFKRLDFDFENLEQYKLKYRRNNSNDIVSYYDITFNEWRDYLLFDTSFVIDTFKGINYTPLNTAPGKGIFKFYNTRRYPCSILILKNNL